MQGFWRLTGCWLVAKTGEAEANPVRCRLSHFWDNGAGRPPSAQAPGSRVQVPCRDSPAPVCTVSWLLGQSAKAEVMNYAGHCRNCGFEAEQATPRALPTRQHDLH